MIRRANSANADDGLQAAADSLRAGWDPRVVARLRQAGEDGVAALLQAYRTSEGRDESENMNRALIGMGKIAVPRLIDLLDDLQLAAGATWALGAIGDRRAVEPLMRSARTASHPEVRISATRALGQLRDRRAFDTVVAQLQDEATQVAAIGALVELGDKRAVDPLRRLAAGSSGTAEYARSAIGQLGSG